MKGKKYGILLRYKNGDSDGLVHGGGEIESFDSIKGATKKATDWVEHKTWGKEERFYGASIVPLKRNFHKMDSANSDAYSSPIKTYVSDCFGNVIEEKDINKKLLVNDKQKERKLIKVFDKKIEVESLEIRDRIKVISENNWDTYGWKGTIIGFDTYAQPRYPNKEGKKPGIYENPWWCKVEFDKKKKGKKLIEFVSSCNIEVLNKKNWRAGLMFGEREDKFIQDLPETNFYELDKVKFRRKNKNMLVGKINYDKIYEKQSGGSLYHLVYSEDEIRNCVLGYAENKDLSLIKRGNVWNYYHDKKLSFENIKEEANFYINLGKCERLSSDANGKYWTKESVLKEIEAKNVDGFVMNNKEITALKFKDENFGERVRKLTLDGFWI